jgi:uncharacterized membrane protein
MITLNYLYYILGASLAVIATFILFDRTNPRRIASGLFWLCYAAVFLAGNFLSPVLVGLLVVLMAGIAGMGWVVGGTPKMPSEPTRIQSALKLGNRLFIPALTIPVVTLLISLLSSRLKFGNVYLIDKSNPAVVGFGIGCVVALSIARYMTRDTLSQSMREARRLVDALSWAAVLPQMLGMLGLVFSDAGVGSAVAHLSSNYLNLDARFAAVGAYCIGMALLTMLMGNGFAAFPVITGGIGIPVLVGVFHGNPAVMVAIGMSSGYCGTLMTPMAANYNFVPANLLELPDKYTVIRIQIPTALTVLVVNIFLLNWLMFL